MPCSRSRSSRDRSGTPTVAIESAASCGATPAASPGCSSTRGSVFLRSTVCEMDRRARARGRADARAARRPRVSLPDSSPIAQRAVVRSSMPDRPPTTCARRHTELKAPTGTRHDPDRIPEESSLLGGWYGPCPFRPRRYSYAIGEDSGCGGRGGVLDDDDTGRRSAQSRARASYHDNARGAHNTSAGNDSTDNESTDNESTGNESADDARDDVARRIAR